ncbi:TPA: glycoside hydrolase family 19 protein [Citrobacter freundii]
MLDLTGRANYDAFGKAFNKDYTTHPESVANNPYVAVKSACYFWNIHHVNTAADNDDIDKVTLIVNGGNNGLDDRKAALRKAKHALGIK